MGWIAWLGFLVKEKWTHECKWMDRAMELWMVWPPLPPCYCIKVWGQTARNLLRNLIYWKIVSRGVWVWLELVFFFFFYTGGHAVTFSCACVHSVIKTTFYYLMSVVAPSRTPTPASFSPIPQRNTAAVCREFLCRNKKKKKTKKKT